MLPKPILSHLMHDLNLGESSSRIWAASVFSKNPKVNNRPLGENSYNLVSLIRNERKHICWKTRKVEDELHSLRR
jgi:hypothetical protein